MSAGRRRRSRGGPGYGLVGLAAAVLIALLALAGWWLLPAGIEPGQAVQAVQQTVLPSPTPVPGDPNAQTPGQTPGQTPSPSADPALDEESRLYREIYEAVDNEQQTVQVTTGDEPLLRRVLKRIQYRPEFFWLNGYTMQYAGNDYQVTFDWKYDDLPGRRAQVEQVAQQALAAVPAGAGDYETALALHDWLCEHIVYEFSSDGSDQDIYGALVNGRCVCAGYSAAYEYLLTRMGMQAETVRGVADNGSGPPENHAWNKVVMEGEVYYTDVTWDDQDDGYVHYWFGLTSARMGQTHTGDPDEGAEMTPSAAVACNYYYRNGYMLEMFDRSRLVEILAAQSGGSFTVGAADQDTFDRLMAELQAANGVPDLLREAGWTDSFTQWTYSTQPGALCVRVTLS